MCGWGRQTCTWKCRCLWQPYLVQQYVLKCKMTIRFDLAICLQSLLQKGSQQSQRCPNKATHCCPKGKTPSVSWWSVQST